MMRFGSRGIGPGSVKASQSRVLEEPREARRLERRGVGALVRRWLFRSCLSGEAAG